MVTPFMEFELMLDGELEVPVLCDSGYNVSLLKSKIVMLKVKIQPPVIQI